MLAVRRSSAWLFVEQIEFNYKIKKSFEMLMPDSDYFWEKMFSLGIEFFI